MRATRDSKPSLVATYVLSPIWSRSGAGAVDSRATGFGAGTGVGSTTIMRARRHRWRSTSPAARSSRAARLRAHRTPAARRTSAAARG